MNMSYCRFYNTKISLDQCLGALNDWDEKLSDEEIEKGKQMFIAFLEYCAENQIIDGYDSDVVDDIFEEKKEEEQLWD